MLSTYSNIVRIQLELDEEKLTSHIQIILYSLAVANILHFNDANNKHS